MKNFTICPFCQNEGFEPGESNLVLYSTYELEAIMKVDENGELQVLDLGSDDGMNSDAAFEGRLRWECLCGAEWSPPIEKDDEEN